MTKKKNRRRRRGEGSIAQRKDGSWTGYILTNRFENGRRKRRYASGETYEKVRRKLAKMQAESDAGTLADVSEMMVGQHLIHWLDNSVKGTVRESSFDNYKNLVVAHINPRIGGMRVTTVSEQTVEKLVADVAEAASAGIAGNCLMLLKRAFRKLVPRLLPSNPCENVAKPRTTKAEIQPLSKQDAERLIDAFENYRLGPLYVVAILSGARMGELLALAWSDVDFETGAISINRTLSNTGRKRRIDEPKSKSSRRRILLPKRAVDALHEHRKRMLLEGNANAKTVFCKKNGGIIPGPTLHCQFKTLLKRHGLPIIRFHDLRHTHATLLLIAGENPKIVSERLGHSKISMTMDIYSHVMPSMQEQAKNKLDNLFGKSG